MKADTVCGHDSNNCRSAVIQQLNYFVFALVLAVISVNVHALTLDQAVAIALDSDPAVKGHQASSHAYAEDSVAAGTLPDPRFRLGMFNVPLDSFDLDQEPMTQLSIGVEQMIPKGDSLDIMQQRNQWLAKAARFDAQDEQRKVILNVRETYYDLYYQVEAGRIIDATRALFTRLVDITEKQYASGRANQQDVLRADLELSRLDDRATELLAGEEMQRAALAQWIGEAAWQPLDKNLPALVETPVNTDVSALLMQHPGIEAQTARVSASRSMTEIARQDYKPGMNAFVEYRKRFGENPDGTERVDMMAAMVTFDIPLFTADRQDKSLAAAEQKANAVRFVRDDKLRQLKRMYDMNMAALKRLKQRHNLYQKELIESAKNNASAALSAYQAGVTEFTSLMRARITELDVRLADLRVRVDREKARARLLYVTGEEK